MDSVCSWGSKLRMDGEELIGLILLGFLGTLAVLMVGEFFLI
jgi:hypothetical protein